MNTITTWVELADMLAREWRGESIDRLRARELASTLLPHHPEMRATLTHLNRRLTAA